MKGRSNDLEELTEHHTAGLRAINERLQQETGELCYHKAQANEEALNRAYDEL